MHDGCRSTRDLRRASEQTPHNGRALFRVELCRTPRHNSTHNGDEVTGSSVVGWWSLVVDGAVGVVPFPAVRAALVGVPVVGLEVVVVVAQAAEIVEQRLVGVGPAFGVVGLFGGTAAGGADAAATVAHEEG